MLLRLAIENILSFRQQTVFNTFPAGIKSKAGHKIEIDNVEWLKITSIYGANGAGKSNFVKTLKFLKEAITDGCLDDPINNFRLDNDYHLKKPSKLGIDFYNNQKFFKYEFEFKGNKVLREILWKNSNLKKPTLIFERTSSRIDQKVHLKFNEIYTPTEKDKLRISILEEDIINKDSLVISNTTIHKIIDDVTDAFNWLTQKLFILSPQSHIAGLPIRLAKEKELYSFFNDTLCALDTGVKKININERPFDEFFIDDNKKTLDDIKSKLNENAGKGYVLVETSVGQVIVEKKGNNFIVNKLDVIHKSKILKDSEAYSFEITEESDGTQRLFDLLPVLYDIMHKDSTFIVDEIERSIHPVIIKEMLQKFSNHEFKGQLLFTTHESTLLDLDIFRQDEIWFAEKDDEGATSLYPLSEFKPRFDLDIRKGYLAGRFGAIPFLSNFQDLKWDMMPDSDHLETKTSAT